MGKIIKIDAKQCSTKGCNKYIQEDSENRDICNDCHNKLVNKIIATAPKF